eukprot:CAMPEP_0178897732 /NCGR_PEP_ID=MMETSP0786-20121207/1918_1 /TAXON_ID=186022 /ORGANISM="Thalassionema frauenfeldii, Strain CCMP 1798" /LENGTH=232 /DNA_ID=CAMNT_0020568331 /DNA_START=985 /DNA_END=1683 /DNA_ORIENTATION=-
MEPFSTPPRKQACDKIIHDCLDDSTGKTQVVTEEVPMVQVKCKTLSCVLSLNECQAIIDRSETFGFKPALLNVGGGLEVYDPNARNSDRVIVDDPQFAAALYERLKEFLPQSVSEGNKKYFATGLNERMRILRYKKGHCFPSHSDGCYERPDGSEISFFTIMVYLNESFEGGETLFFPDKFHSNYEKSTAVTPKTGLVSCFEHHVMHEGALVTKGVKYAIRTDLMFADLGGS